MPRVSKAHKEARRAEILDSARSCFARSGFQGATLQDIFAEARLSAGAVYNYFKSKRELILAIAETRHAQERVALATDADDPVAALKIIARRFIGDYLSGGDTKRRISLMTWSEALLDEAILKSVRAGVNEPQRVLKAVIENGQRQGVLRKDMAPVAIAAAMTAMLQGLVLQKLWNPGLSAGAMAEACEMLIDGLRA
jgi:AcrR family transcriptional regulator